MEALAEMASDTEENTPKALGLLGDLESDSEGGLNDLQDLGDLGDDVDMGFHGLADLRGDWEQEEGDKMQDELPMEAAEWDEPLDGQQQDIPDTVRDQLWLASDQSPQMALVDGFLERFEEFGQARKLPSADAVICAFC